MERDEWERKALHEHIVADESRSTTENLRRDLEIEREAREREATALQVEREKVANLQSVLEDFQGGTSSPSPLFYNSWSGSQGTRVAAGGT